jgi:hypothetical protein
VLCSSWLILFHLARGDDKCLWPPVFFLFSEQCRMLRTMTDVYDYQWSPYFREDAESFHVFPLSRCSPFFREHAFHTSQKPSFQMDHVSHEYRIALLNMHACLPFNLLSLLDIFWKVSASLTKGYFDGFLWLLLNIKVPSRVFMHDQN